MVLNFIQERETRRLAKQRDVSQAVKDILQAPVEKPYSVNAHRGQPQHSFFFFLLASCLSLEL